MVGLLLILAVLSGVAGMLLLSLLPAAWMGLVVLAGMGGALGALAMMAAARWRAHKLDRDFRRSPGQILRGQGRAFRLYFLGGGLLPAFALTLLAGVLLLLAGPRIGSLAFFGAVAGAGTMAFLGALQGLLPRSKGVRETLALCWKRLPRLWMQEGRVSVAGGRGKPPSDTLSPGLAPILAGIGRVWRLLSSNLLLVSRYRSAADADLRSPAPALPGLTRVLDRRRSGGGGRAPKLVSGGWTAPLSDALARTLALALTAVLLLPVMWLAAKWLPPPGALAMGDQLRRLAYSRQAQNRTSPDAGPQGAPQQDSESSSAGQPPDVSQPQPGQGPDSRREASDNSGRTSQPGNPSQSPSQDPEAAQGRDAANQPEGQARQPGEEAPRGQEARRGDPGRAGAGEQGQEQESGSEPGSGSGSGAGNRDPSGEDAQQGPDSGSGQKQESSGQTGGSQQGEGASGQGGTGTEGGQRQGLGAGGGDPEMDFDQPLVEVPDLRPEEALELDLPALDEAGKPGQEAAQGQAGDRPAPAAASRDRSARGAGQRPQGEASSQRLPNWIRVLWDRLSNSQAPQRQRPKPQPPNRR